jgi:hypothetical protein
MALETAACRCQLSPNRPAPREAAAAPRGAAWLATSSAVTTARWRQAAAISSSSSHKSSKRSTESLYESASAHGVFNFAIERCASLAQRAAPARC